MERGQTGLAVALARRAKVIPAMVMYKMRDGETGKVLSEEDERIMPQRVILPIW